MKKLVSVLIIAMTVISLSACGKGGDTSDLDTSSVEVKKDGSVISTVIDDFAEDYYDPEELKAMAEEEISAFNLTNGEDSIELLSVDKKDDRIKVVTKYKNPEIYAHFNSETFVYETAEEAGGLTGSFVDREGGAVSSDALAALSKEHVIVTSNKTIVAAPYKIKYVSAGASLSGDYMADLSQTDAESTTYIVLCK